MSGFEDQGCLGGHGNREELIREKLRHEDAREEAATKDAHELTRALLEEKGYTPEEIIENPAFPVQLPGKPSENVTTDYLIKISGEPAMVIKCSMAVESRERHILALARTVGERPIPLCVVTDGLKANVLRTATGETMSESFEEFPASADIQDIVKASQADPLPEDRKARETMILMAFESTACPRTDDQ